MSRNERVFLAVLLLVGVVVVLSALGTQRAQNPSSTSSCQLSQELVDELMVGYLQAHAAGDVTMMASLRTRLERHTQCSSPAYSAVLGWTRAVLADDQAGMTMHDEYLIKAIREAQR